MGVIKKIIGYLVLFMGALSFLFPFIWMASATLKPEIEISQLNLIPSTITFESYKSVFQKIPIVRALLNSLFVTSAITSSVLVFSSMVGYALARLRFKGRKVVFNLILFTMMIPFQITLIPTYILIVKFGWINTYQGLIIPGMISAFAIVLFRQYFKSIPEDLLDAARIDGCHEISILFRVIWPNSLPALATVGIITFLTTWNEVLWPLIIIRDQQLMTMPQMVTLFSIGGSAEAQQGVILASAMLLAIPIVTLYLFFQRFIIESMVSSGIKG